MSVVSSIPTCSVLGPQVTLLNPSMPVSLITKIFNDIYEKQVTNEMGKQRYCLFFLPGTYGSPDTPLFVKLGYSTEVAGLGMLPGDVMIHGNIQVYNRAFEKEAYEKRNEFIPAEGKNPDDCVYFALNNFWRSLSNLSIQVINTPDNTDTSTVMFWAVSQACSMRRVDVIADKLSLMDYLHPPAYASGGYIADSRATLIIAGSQQQFFVRNSEVSEWQPGGWNSVLLGVSGITASSPSVVSSNVSTLSTNLIGPNPLSRGKPHIYATTNATDTSYFVFVPDAVTNTIGTTWSKGQESGTSIPLSDFFIVDAKSVTNIQEINAALSTGGKHLLFLPGVYDISESILVPNANTIVLGIGLATVTAKAGVTPMILSDQPGIVVAGLTFDAGEKSAEGKISDVLLQVGPPRSLTGSTLSKSNPLNPITISDVYFRVGGPHIGCADVCLQVNCDNVLIDHIWVWRADHGEEGFTGAVGTDGDSERWKTNIGRCGVEVNGENVTATGMFVEHFQQHNVVWNGHNGKVFFFQNELPYDPPSQADWTTPSGTLGWAAYKVAEHVAAHELHCAGVYVFNRNCPTIITTNAIEVPKASGIKIYRALTKNLNGPGSITSIVNGVGTTVNDNDRGPYYANFQSGQNEQVASLP